MARDLEKPLGLCSGDICNKVHSSTVAIYKEERTKKQPKCTLTGKHVSFTQWNTTQH